MSKPSRDDHRPRQRIVLLLAPAVLCPLAVGAEGPGFNISVQSVQNIYTATPSVSTVPGFKPHINFPYMKQRADGTLEATFTVGQTHGAGVFGMTAYSYDGGMTWTGLTRFPPSTPNSSLVRPAGQTSYGISMAFSDAAGRTSWTNGRYTTANGGLSWSAGTSYWNTGSIAYISAYNNLGDMIQVGTNTLLTTAYLQRPGQSTFEDVLFASTDGGVNWTRRSTIAGYVAGGTVSMGSEGPTEGSVVQLNNGSLLSVYRTGQSFPSNDVNLNAPSLFWSISSDQGYTWTTPKMLGVAGVFPLLRKLDDGAVALTYGRYGTKVMFADETGLRWSMPSVIYNGPGSGHCEMRKRADGKYVFVYDQSSFYPPSWDASPPAGYVYNNDQSANLKAAILSIQRTNPDEFHWAAEYHGDEAPETVSPSWTKTQSGIASTFYWADLGQDYLHIDTGGSGGAANSLYYSMSGPSSAWAATDYAASGAVIDIRSRAGAATTEGSADVVAGDGTSGYFSLELTGSSVILEGQGGNASQAVYTEAAHPGFSTESWHTYRVVVAPDAAAGGSVRARLFLDGDYASPILSIALNTAALDQLYFGDVTGTNNGVFDVDFLRFSALAARWNVDAPGNWSAFGNWSTSVPNSVDATATFAGAISAARTITVDAPVTLGHIRFDSDNRYTLAGPGAITLQVSGGAADITLAAGSHTISAPLNVLSSAAIIGPGALTTGDITNAASLSVQTSVTSGNIDGTGTLAVAAGSTLSAARIRQSGLLLNGSAQVRASGSAAAISRVQSLAIAPGGWLDLLDNDLIVDYAGASPLGAIASLIAGKAMRSSAADDRRGLGYADNLALGLASFGGQSVDPTSILVKYTYFGDGNLDGRVDVIDLGALATSWQSSGSWMNGDFTGDGFVDVVDLGLLATNWQAGVGNPLGPQTLTEALAGYGLPAAVVPEPSFALSSGLLLLLLNRRSIRERKRSCPVR